MEAFLLFVAGLMLGYCVRWADERWMRHGR